VERKNQPRSLAKLLLDHDDVSEVGTGKEGSAAKFLLERVKTINNEKNKEHFYILTEGGDCPRLSTMIESQKPLHQRQPIYY
jgi:hypothetical protein